MSEESVIYASIISGFGAIIIVIIKHWRSSKCWTKNECCSCNLYREPSSPNTNTLDTTINNFKVDLNIKDDDSNDDDNDDNDDTVDETIININHKLNTHNYLSSIDEEHIPNTLHKIKIQETDPPLENISQV